MPAYFDANATTPIDPRVLEIVVQYLSEDFGNAGSRTHSFGTKAATAVESARDQIREALNANDARIVFTSGATESNNLAILGLEEFGRRTGNMHIVSTAIEHKAVLEPLDRLKSRGFEISLVSPSETGIVAADKVLAAVRQDTLLVSVMHVNNETGMIQPISEIADGLANTQTVFHVDAAQGFGKDTGQLKNPNVDLISLSGHKVYAPKGVGALVINGNRHKPLELSPLLVGGGQESGLRPGTLPVPLIAGFGLAARLAGEEHTDRHRKNLDLLAEISTAAQRAGGTVNGDLEHDIGNVLNVSFVGVDSESAMLLLREDVAISNGAACSSASYSYSHVLRAMGLDEQRVQSALRVSWFHDSPHMDWERIFGMIANLR